MRKGAGRARKIAARVDHKIFAKKNRYPRRLIRGEIFTKFLEEK